MSIFCLIFSISTDKLFSVPTLKEIEEWRKQYSISRQELADMLHVNYKALCPILAGTRPLTSRLAARIVDLMENHDKGLTITLPHEFAPLLTTWAATANLSVDELVTQLLADALKINHNKPHDK